MLAETIGAPHRVIAASTSLQRPIEFAIDLNGLTLSGMVESAIARGILPARFLDHGRIEIDGDEIPRANWRLVRPKQGRHIFMAITHAGGDSGGAKNVIAIVAAVFLVVATAGIAAGALVPLLGTAFAAGSIGAQIAAGVVGLVGQLAIAALFKPPQEDQRQESAPVANDARLAGNVLSKGQTLPRVVGSFRVFPPLLAQPRSYLSGDDVYAEAVFALAGPHSIEDIEIDDVDGDDLNDVEITVDDGTADLRVNAFDRYAVTDSHGYQLTLHKTRVGESGYTDQELVDQEDPENSLPKWHRMQVREGCDYADITLTFASLYDATEPGWQSEYVWLRLRARKEGESAWKNIGTIPYRAQGQGSFNRRIRLYFKEYPGGLSSYDKTKNAFMAPTTLPVVTVNHVDFLTTDSDRFPAAYSHDWVVQREGIDCWLNDSYFMDTESRYEVEIKRSEMVKATDLNDPDTMEESSGSEILDFLDARYSTSSGNKYVTYNNLEERSGVIVLQSIQSVFESLPIPSNAPIATLQVRVRNQDFKRVSAIASGLVPDWDGSEWTGQVATSNPAAQFRYLLTGDMTVDPIAPAYVDDTTLVAWRAECTAQGYACDAVLAGTLEDALDLVAACGFARPDLGLKYGVVYHRDLTEVTPTQAFTARNVRNLSWSVVYSMRPSGFNCEFFNAARNYELDELIVDDPYAIEGGATDIEAVRYPGLTTEAQVTQRAEFDFDQARKAVRYSFEIGIEYLATARGEVAILSHDALHRHAGWGRVVEVVDAVSFRVDSDFAYTAGDSFFDLPDVFQEEDIFTAGADPGVMVRTATNDVLIWAVAAFDQETRVVTISDASPVSVGDLAIFGPLEQVTKRVQVTSIDPLDLETARVTVQDIDAVAIVAGTGAVISPAAASITVTGYAPTVSVETITCELTAATAGPLTGYVAGSLGSIDQEPFTGQVFKRLTVFGGLGQTAFAGDLTAELSGLSIWVDSVEYPFTVTWSYDSGDDETVGQWSSGAPSLSASSTYTIEVK